MKTVAATKQRWKRPEGWHGTWEDIFEEMGWDPADVDSVDWSIPRRGRVKEAFLAGEMEDFEVDMTQDAGVTLEGEDLTFRAEITKVYAVDFARVVTLFGGYLNIEPRLRAT